MANLYILDLRTRPPAQWKQLLPTLLPDRQQRVKACRKEIDQARITFSGWLMQYALEQAGIPRSRQQFTENDFGKPLLVDGSCHFSLSHSGPWVVCATADSPVGVDVELPRCSAAVAQRFFHPEEVALADDPDQLCRLWTAKEAFVKALGVGITIPLNRFRVQLHGDTADLHQQETPLPYLLHEYRLDSSRICLCTTDPRPEPILL